MVGIESWGTSSTHYSFICSVHDDDDKQVDHDVCLSILRVRGKLHVLLACMNKRVIFIDLCSFSTSSDLTYNTYFTEVLYLEASYVFFPKPLSIFEFHYGAIRGPFMGLAYSGILFPRAVTLQTKNPDIFPVYSTSRQYVGEYAGNIPAIVPNSLDSH